VSNCPTRLAVYLEHRTQLVDYATPITGCRATAEDLVQDAWLRFVASEAPIAQPVGYLYRIVRNLALDQLRRKAGREEDSDTHDLDALADQRSGPEAHAVTHDELERVSQAIEGLPPRTRRAFELYRLHGQTLHQVAAALDISVGSAHQLVHAALKQCVMSLDTDDD
jgi:RNA polymerase sigma-70 factor (ECF subfamily)